MRLVSTICLIENRLKQSFKPNNDKSRVLKIYQNTIQVNYFNNRPLAYPIHNIFNYATRWNLIARLLQCLLPYIRLHSQFQLGFCLSAIVVRWSALEFADQWSVKTFEDFHIQQQSKSLSRRHHAYSRSLRKTSQPLPITLAKTGIS